MVSSNDVIDTDYHHRIPHSNVDETVALLGSGSSTSSSASSRGSRRFGSVGFMIAFVVLSSSAFVFLMNKQQGTPFSFSAVGSTIGEAQELLKEQAPDNVDLSPFTSHDNGLYYTYDGFSRGAGSPIFATDYADYVAEMETPLGKFISKNAENAGASILILGQHFQDADADKVEDYITNGKGCNQSDPTNVDYCLILIVSYCTMHNTIVRYNRLIQYNQTNDTIERFNRTIISKRNLRRPFFYHLSLSLSLSLTHSLSLSYYSLF
mmetsp:Transcript_9247/g.10252  ORF Transcript_9247/g.10252 Transcript_9247/m.10252 type:complete len:265 (+) Transcript_9247:169-963(+)